MPVDDVTDMFVPAEQTSIASMMFQANRDTTTTAASSFTYGAAPTSALNGDG